MGLTYRGFSILIFVFFLKPVLQAQEINIGITNYLTIAKSNDLGLDFRYLKNLGENAVVVGAEIRSVDWGNHLGLVLGYKADYFERESIKIGGLTSLHPGLALFQQGSLGSFGFAYVPYFRWKSKKRSYLQFDMGFRYNVSPGYKEFGNNQQIEFPIGLRWGIVFGNQDE